MTTRRIHRTAWAAALALASAIAQAVAPSTATAAPVATLRPAPLQAPPVALERAFRLDVQIGAPLELGSVDGLRKPIIPITGGSLQGPRIRAAIVPGGADWQGIRETVF